MYLDYIDNFTTQTLINIFTFTLIMILVIRSAFIFKNLIKDIFG